MPTSPYMRVCYLIAFKLHWLACLFAKRVFLTVGAFFKHADLLMKLTEGTGPDGTVAQIGQIVIDWVCMHIKYVGVYLVSVIFQYFPVSTCKNVHLPSCQVWMLTKSIAATSLQLKPFSTRKSRTGGCRTSCSAAWSPPSAGNWTSGVSWISHVHAWWNTHCCCEKSSDTLLLIIQT